MAEGQIQGWKDGNIEVLVDGTVQALQPVSLDAQPARDHVLGDGSEEADAIQAGDGVARIGGISVPARRDTL